jgi:transposase
MYCVSLCAVIYSKQNCYKVMKKAKPLLGVTKISSGLPVFNAHAAGIDVGDTLHYVAISNGSGGHDVKTTCAFTSDLKEIVSYLQAHGITTAALESTGIYWLPLYLLLEEAGIEPYLVNAAHVKNVTGRKKDDTDAIWLQKLHTCGLLNKSYQPDSEMRTLRAYTRHRKNLIFLAADAVRRMQKSLELMNIKLHTVISDILGKTGLLMVKAIIGGERDPEVLYTLCDPRIKASQEDILKSLDGVWHEEHLFMLQQALEHYEFHHQQIKACEAKIQAQLTQQVAIVEQGDLTLLETLNKEVEKKTTTERATERATETIDGSKKKGKDPKKKKGRKNQFNTPVAPALTRLTGIDLTKIPGISEVTALELIAEIGLDMSKWATAKQFAAWLNLTPNTKITGGKIISSKMVSKDNKAGLCLKQAASTLANSKSPMGDYYRTVRAKLGGKGAVIATAHKLARLIYTMLMNKTEYNQDILTQNKENVKERKIKKLEKQLEKLKKAA